MKKFIKNNILGFTLVELLGVIVVLAILSLITIPIISNVISDVRIKSLKASAYGLIEASNLYYAQYGSSNIRFDINDNKVESSDTDNLISYKGSIKTGTVILDKKGNVTVCITDGKNSAYKNYNEKKVTTSKGKICSIKENSSIVYLDDKATINEYDNAKLTELVNELKEEINDLKNSDSTQNSQISNLENNSTTIDEIYPVGSIYISTTDDTVSDVENRFGGTWISFGNGRTLMSSTDTSEQTGGSSTATFTPSGTVGNTTLTVAQMPSHMHDVVHAGWLDGKWDFKTFNGSGISGTSSWSDNGPIFNAWSPPSTNNGSGLTWLRADWNGSSQPHTHSFTGNQTTIDTVSPYITVYMYKRTA